MIALDTNVLVRAILQDDAVQSPKAQRHMAAAAKEEGLFVSAFAVLELAWVLRSCKVPKAKVVETLRTLLAATGISVGHRPQVAAALDAFESGKGDFADYLIQQDGAFNGAHGFLSFDAILRKEGLAKTP